MTNNRTSARPKQILSSLNLLEEEIGICLISVKILTADGEILSFTGELPPDELQARLGSTENMIRFLTKVTNETTEE